MGCIIPSIQVIDIKQNSTNNGEMVMMATSSDFKTWTKNRVFRLKGDDYGYSKDDFRDPFVFKGDDNKWHMLVSTLKGSKGHFG